MTLNVELETRSFAWVNVNVELETRSFALVKVIYNQQSPYVLFTLLHSLNLCILKSGYLSKDGFEAISFEKRQFVPCVYCNVRDFCWAIWLANYNLDICLSRRILKCKSDIDSVWNDQINNHKSYIDCKEQFVI